MIRFRPINRSTQRFAGWLAACLLMPAASACSEEKPEEQAKPKVVQAAPIKPLKPAEKEPPPVEPDTSSASPASPVPEPVKPKPPPEEATPKKPTPAEIKVAKLLDAVQRVKRATRNFSADLQFREESILAPRPIVTKGSIQYKGRGRARVSFHGKKGRETRYIEDGPFLWRYWPATGKKKQKAEKYFQGSATTVRTMLDMMGSSVEQLKKRFDIKLGKAARRGHQLLTFSFLRDDPRRSIRSITVEFDKQYRPVVLAIKEDNGDVRRWTLTNIESNDPKLDKLDLRFRPKTFTDRVSEAATERQIDLAILEIVRERAAWPWGWHGSYHAARTDAQKVAVETEVRFVVSVEGGFRFRFEGRRDGGLFSVTAYDGTTFRKRVSGVGGVGVMKELEKKATPAEAREMLNGSTRLALQAIRGDLFRIPAAFHRIRPKKPKDPDAPVEPDPEYEYAPDANIEKRLGVNRLRLYIDKRTFRVTRLTYTTVSDGAVSGTMNVVLNASPRVTPVVAGELALAPEREENAAGDRKPNPQGNEDKP